MQFVYMKSTKKDIIMWPYMVLQPYSGWTWRNEIARGIFSPQIAFFAHEHIILNSKTT